MSEQNYPFSFEESDEELLRSKLVRIHPGGFALMEHFKKEMPRIYNFEVRPDDVFLVGLPKSGTTWATEAIWTVYHDADVEAAKKKSTLERWATIENNGFIATGSHTMHKLGKESQGDYTELPEYMTRDVIEALKKADSPRFIRSHFPLSLLPPNLLDTCKVVYIARDFRDCHISFHSMKKGGDYDECDDFNKSLDLIISNKAFLTPWPAVVKQAWEKRHHKNMLFVFYEDLKKDLPSFLKSLATFLEKLLSQEQIEKLVDHLSIEKMRKNKSTSMHELKTVGAMGKDTPFIRKGIAGDWKNYYTAEMLEKYNKWFNTYMNDTDFKFPE